MDDHVFSELSTNVPGTLVRAMFDCRRVNIPPPMMPIGSKVIDSSEEPVAGDHFLKNLIQDL
jgi:hypothetical protein